MGAEDCVEGMAKLRRKVQGVSLVELLVGLAIGLFLLAGALSLFSQQSKTAMSVTLEAQLNRNLRQAADFLEQDLRRAGAWENAVAGAPSATRAPIANPHSTLTATASSIEYSYGQDNARQQPSGLNLANTDEQFGVRLNNGTLEAAVGQGRWQPLTDTRAVEITRFVVMPRVTSASASDACRKTCCEAVLLPTCPQVNAPQGCPKVQRVAYDIEIGGRSRRDPRLARVLNSQVQVRNELIVGMCPA